MGRSVGYHEVFINKIVQPGITILVIFSCPYSSPRICTLGKIAHKKKKERKREQVLTIVCNCVGVVDSSPVCSFKRGNLSKWKLCQEGWGLSRRSMFDN